MNSVSKADQSSLQIVLEHNATPLFVLAFASEFEGQDGASKPMLELVVGVGGMRTGGLVGIGVGHGTLVEYLGRRKGRWAGMVVVLALVRVVGRDQVKQIKEVNSLLQTVDLEDKAKVVVELQHSP